jgi:acetyltransferase-like isoleucine patch superfamily enzyme
LLSGDDVRIDASSYSDLPAPLTEESEGLPAFAAFGPCSEIGRPIRSIVNAPGISIGAFVKIGSGAIIEALVPERSVTVTIHDGAYIGHGLRLTAVGEVVIGEEAMLADDCYVSDTNHIYEDVTEPIKRQGLRDGRRVEIGPGAWLGIGAIVCGNLRVGRNAVIGAHCVVTSDVPELCVVTGNPARIVRRWEGDKWEWLPRGGEPLS